MVVTEVGIRTVSRLTQKQNSQSGIVVTSFYPRFISLANPSQTTHRISRSHQRSTTIYVTFDQNQHNHNPLSTNPHVTLTWTEVLQVACILCLLSTISLVRSLVLAFNLGLFEIRVFGWEQTYSR
jgi:hypothetical protein